MIVISIGIVGKYVKHSTFITQVFFSKVSYQLFWSDLIKSIEKSSFHRYLNHTYVIHKKIILVQWLIKFQLRLLNYWL